MNLPFEEIREPAVRGHRDSREAADAGLLLWRENCIFFLPFFAVPFWICAFALRLLPGNAQYFSWLVLWLLKPLFDRPILHVISVRFFERGAGMKRLCRGLGKSLTRGLLGDLLWRRFTPLRSAMMPVRVLEPAGKKNRPNRSSEIAERKKMLKKSGLGYCFFLSLWGVALEITLLIGEILFVITMAELIRKGFISTLWSSLQNVEIYIFAAWCFNYMLVETLYVCMGFSLYINSRVQVEGWDIEIMFHKFAEKIKAQNMNGAIIIFCLVCMFAPVRGFAADRELITASEDVPLGKLQEILDSPDFGGEKDSWGIRLKNPRRQRNIPDTNINPLLKKLRQIFASALRLILIALIAGLILFLLFYLRRLRSIYKFRRGGSSGVDGRVKNNLTKKIKESPESLLNKAVVFFEQGNIRLAWGYCTAAAILSWPLYRGLVFPPNATESDCVNIVNSQPASLSCNPAEAQAFSGLINNWVNLAYAGRLPPAEGFEEAVALSKRLRQANG